MLSFVDSYQMIRKGAGWCRVPADSLIRLSGADVYEWLQGQATNDVRLLQANGSIEFCFCKPTGQIVAPVLCALQGDEHVLIVPSITAEAVLQRCVEMVIMEDVAATLDPDDIFTVQGKAAGSAPGCVAHDRCGFGGYDCFEKPPEGFPELDPRALEVCALEAGLPLYGVDYGLKAMPPELGSVFEHRNVSYNKGCYTGQEVLMRLHSRGHTNRTWTLIALSGKADPGEEIRDQSGALVGGLTRCLVSPRRGSIGAGFVRNEALEPGTTVTVGPASGTVVAAPLG